MLKKWVKEASIKTRDNYQDNQLVKKERVPVKSALLSNCCGPTWARTRDPLIMSQVL